MMPATDPPDSDSPLDVALAYAACGLRVLPIRPGQKHPPMNSWQHAATVDPKTIRNWWNGLYRNHGVGLAMGPQPDGRWLFTLDVDRHNVDGFDTLYELEQTHGVLPETVCSVTGSGGAHYIFDAGSVQVTNGAAGAVGPGIDIRGAGGQIVVAPSLHPNGQPYGWEDGHAPWETAIAPAPAWLLDLVTPQATTPTEAGVALPNSRPGMPATHDHSPADQLRQDWDWPAELARRGWQHAKGDQWTRPGKNPREGTSGVLHDGGPFVVFTTDTSVEALWRAGKAGNGCVSLSPLAFIAAYDHGGDIAAAGKALRAAEAPVDLATLIAPHTATQTPTSGHNPLLINWPDFWNTDFVSEEWIAWPLIPAGRQVALYAPAKTGKSIVTLAACAAAATGRPIFGAPAAPPRNVLYLDYEMTASDLHERLETLGYSADDDLTHFHYALLPALPPLNTDKGCLAVCQLAAEVDAAAVVIDTMGRAVVGEESKSDSYREFAQTTGIALKAAGRAMLRTDHAGKEREKGQRGSSAKNDDVDIVYRIDKAEGGWTITRTHSRVSWAPEKVAIDRHERDDHAELVAVRKDKVYAAGTKELADQLRGLGVTPDTTKRAATEMFKASGGKASSVRIGDALLWIKAEAPRFGGLIQAQNHAQNHPTSDSPEPFPEPDSGIGQTPRSQTPEPCSEPLEPTPQPSPEPFPPYKGERSEGPPQTNQDPPTSPPERMRLI